MNNTKLITNNKSYRVENGLMSGWKTTSIFGTIINYLVFKCVQVLQTIPEPSYLSTQGDDLDMSFSQSIAIDKLY